MVTRTTAQSALPGIAVSCTNEERGSYGRKINVEGSAANADCFLEPARNLDLRLRVRPVAVDDFPLPLDLRIHGRRIPPHGHRVTNGTAAVTYQVVRQDRGVAGAIHPRVDHLVAIELHQALDWLERLLHRVEAIDTLQVHGIEIRHVTSIQGQV